MKDSLDEMLVRMVVVDMQDALLEIALVERLDLVNDGLRRSRIGALAGGLATPTRTITALPAPVQTIGAGEPPRGAR